jgi:TRAP-type mannitol/chloroaromatic compound transport system permease small subunit
LFRVLVVHREVPVAQVLRTIARKIDALQDRFGRLVSWIMLFMVLVVFTDVVLRYMFRTSTVWLQELEWHLFGVVYMLGAGYTMLYDEHVRVDIVYSRWSVRKKAWSDFILYLVFFYPSAIMIVWATIPFVRDSYRVFEGSPDPGGIPLRFLLKSVIIVGFLILMIQAFSQTVKNFFWAMGWEEPEARVKEIH